MSYNPGKRAGGFLWRMIRVHPKRATASITRARMGTEMGIGTIISEAGNEIARWR
jgi:hypothetical protein